MKDYATFLMCGALCLFGCASNEPDPSTESNTSVAGTGTPTANAGAPSAVAGRTAPSAGSTASAGSGGSSAVGTAGKPATGGSGGSGGGAPVMPAAGSGAGGSGAAGGPAAAAGSGGSASPGNMAAPKGSFLAAYTLALRDMCMSCHAVGGIFSSPDLSSPDRAYESLVDKDASMMSPPGECGGKGKLVTPGNCETSLIYNKITQMTPMCGRRMPLSSDADPQLVPQAGIDALCEWIMAGAKKDM